jgi:hypothetical protein
MAEIAAVGEADGGAGKVAEDFFQQLVGKLVGAYRLDPLPSGTPK